MMSKAFIKPNIFKVYQKTSFRVIIKPEKELRQGSLIEVQLPNSFTNNHVSPSHVKNWQMEDKSQENYVGIETNPRIRLDKLLRKREYVGGYTKPTRHGVCLNIILQSAMPEDGEIVITYYNTMTPWLANQKPGETDHEGSVLVKICGEELSPLPAFTVIPGGEAYSRLIVPSYAKPREEFKIQFVSIDKYNNLTRCEYNETVITCNNQEIGILPDFTGRGETKASIDKIGIYRLECCGVVSNPIKISEEDINIYWGDIHIHSYPSVDAMGNTPYEYAKFVSCLDFAACADHGAGGLKRHWEQIRRWAKKWNKSGEFAAFLGFETNMKYHLNGYFYDDDEDAIECMARTGDSSVTAEQLNEYLADKKAVTQIHHTGWGFDMLKQYHPTTKLFEVYSMHGQSELYDPDSPIAFEVNRHRANSVNGPCYLREALATGQRWAVHGSSDNHFCQGGVRVNSVTGVYADKLERADIMDAMAEKRQCYATTGERLIIEFNINGNPMGSEIIVDDNKLDIDLKVYATGNIGSIEVFGCPFIEPSKEPAFEEMRFDINDEMVKKTLDSWQVVYRRDAIDGLDFEDTTCIDWDGRKWVYYLRIIEDRAIELPGELEGYPEKQKRPVYGWSSPIWVTPK